MPGFNDAFSIVVFKEETDGNDVLSLDPKDSGNWTGGAVGSGELKGTKYGVSAAAYPDLDIANLTIDDARSIAKTKYWDPCGCDALGYGIALCLFDFAYNAGPTESIRVLQLSVGTDQDGVMGPQTQYATTSSNQSQLIQNFAFNRLHAYSLMRGWDIYRDTWTARTNQIRDLALASL